MLGGGLCVCIYTCVCVCVCINIYILLNDPETFKDNVAGITRRAGMCVCVCVCVCVCIEREREKEGGRGREREIDIHNERQVMQGTCGRTRAACMYAC